MPMKTSWFVMSWCVLVLPDTAHAFGSGDETVRASVDSSGAQGNGTSNVGSRGQTISS